MNYRSIADMAALIRGCLHAIPADVDLVVGVPRSGLLPAGMIALYHNLPLTDMDGFLENRMLACGRTRPVACAHVVRAHDARHVLVVDDSLLSGQTMRRVRAHAEATGGTRKITYCAVYVAPGTERAVDMHFEALPRPRMFEWNVLHHARLDRCLVDIDGILCRDPEPAENDDGDGYRAFLDAAAPIVRPTGVVGGLVTARLEKYRDRTEAWLRRQGVQYAALHMLDLPDAQARRRAQAHAPFKAGIYRRHPLARLFIESEPGQAAEIARLSGKPVLCFPTQEIHHPGSVVRVAQARAGNIIYRAVRKIHRGIRRLRARGRAAP